MRIPITMCHGLEPASKRANALTAERFTAFVKIAYDMGFQAITYDALAAWREGAAGLPDRPIMFDFDHPVRSIRAGAYDILRERGYVGNLFVNTGPLEEMYSGPLPPDDERGQMTWDEIGELHEAGWQIGAHTVTHPNLSQLSLDDPSGKKIREELATCDATIEERLGLKPKDFAFTGTSWSSTAEREVQQRYRFGRLWIVRSIYQADGVETRYADLVGVPGDDEADGGPPAAARYITKETPAYRLPSMELTALIFEEAAFWRYLQGALAD